MDTRTKLVLSALLSLQITVSAGCSGQTRERVRSQQSAATGSSQVVGEAFENSHFTYIGIPATLSPVDTSPGWKLTGQKILLTGTVYQLDGKTPAPDVVLYYYQTNTEGRYIHKPDETRSMPPNELGQTHGYIRGWVKSDENGRYWIYTVRPGTYPSGDAPAHIHPTIKEPNAIREYYIDDFVFDDDRLVNLAYRKKMENRAGTGVVRLVQQGDMHVGERNIILGLNIPEYPTKNTSETNSGKNIGEDVFSFTPFHVWGPDKGTKTCPICKYGWFHGVLYFVGNHPDWGEIRQWLKFLEAESDKRNEHLKAYFIYGNETDYTEAKRTAELEQIGRELRLQKIALTFVPSFSDTESEVYLNRISPKVENTIIIYRRSSVIDKYVNMKPTEENFTLISRRLDQTRNEYFDLPKAK